MEINVGKVLLTLDGVVMTDGGRPFTLGRAIARAVSESPEQVPGDVKMERYKLAMRFIGVEKTEVNPDEVALIKKAVGLAYSPLIVGRVYEALSE